MTLFARSLLPSPNNSAASSTALSSGRWGPGPRYTPPHENLISFCFRPFYPVYTFQCTKKCGGGYKVRDVVCQQALALGELANKPDRDCPPGKPEFKKSCNQQPCPFDISNTQSGEREEPAKRPLIKANVNQIYEQTNLNQHTVRLKIGGQATVFKGTKLKIRCPVKKFDR